VTVIGDALLDVRARPAMPMRPDADVPAEVDVAPGGQGANVAVRLARRSVPTRLVCRIGPDAAGDLLRRSLVGEGIELLDLGAARSGAVVVLVDPGGDRTMLSQRVPLLETGTPPVAALDGDWLVVSGYVLLERSAGISASGASPRRAIAGCALEPARVDDWIAAARSVQPHLVVVNADEARLLAASDTADAAALSSIAGERLGALVVVTQRAAATAILDREAVTVSAAADPGATVDTTGAGDAFTAALVAGLLDASWPPPRDVVRAAMHDAMELAAGVTRVAGAQGRVPAEGRNGASR
jgi:ribokinase